MIGIWMNTWHTSENVWFSSQLHKSSLPLQIYLQRICTAQYFSISFDSSNAGNKQFSGKLVPEWLRGFQQTHVNLCRVQTLKEKHWDSDMQSFTPNLFKTISLKITLLFFHVPATSELPRLPQAWCHATWCWETGLWTERGNMCRSLWPCWRCNPYTVCGRTWASWGASQRRSCMCSCKLDSRRVMPWRPEHRKQGVKHVF